MLDNDDMYFAKLRQHFQSLSKQAKHTYLSSLSNDEILFFYANPNIFLFDKQIIPDGFWRYMLLQCGRRFGKSVSGAAWTANKIIKGAGLIGLCGEDYSTVQNVMVKNILSMFPPNVAVYSDKHHLIRFNSMYKGAEIFCYTSDKEIKGPSLEYQWSDEVGNWCDRNPDKTQVRFDSLDTAVSVGSHPQHIITTTPRPFPFFFTYQDHIDNHNPNYQIMRGTMFDNPFLSEGYRQKELDKYKNKPNLLRQEIYGELIYENPDALFQRTWIDDNRITSPDNPCHINDIDIAYFFSLVVKGDIILKRGVIPVDPSGSSKSTSDETGIMVLLQDYKNDVYLLHDASGTLSPDQWAQSIRSLFNHYKRILPMVIVAETNFGGDLVISNICSVDKSLKPFIKEIKASKSKMIRAEVSAAKYERGKIHHVGHFEKLERQMVNYVGTKDASMTGSKSPDRLDSLVHGINELVVVPQYATRDIRHLLENV